MNYKKTTLSKISNIIFLNTSIFILFFLWCNFYIKNFKLSLISSCLAIISFGLIYFPIYLHKSKNSKNTKIKKQKILDFANNLLIMNYKEIYDFLTKNLGFKDFKKVSDTFISTNNKDIFFIFTDERIFEIEFLKHLKLRNYDNIEIYCFRKLNNLDIYQNINIKFIEIDTLYELISNNNKESIPSKYKFDKKKIIIKDIFQTIFSKTKSKGYFIYGLIILITSLFTPYNVYYIISATSLLLISIFSRFNTIYN